MNKLQKTRKTTLLLRTGKPTYDGHCKRFSEWLTVNKLAVSKESIGNFLAELAETRSPVTISNYKQAIKKALSMGAVTIDDRARLDACFSDMKIVKVDKKVYTEKVLSANELNKLYKESPKKLRLIMETLAKTGLRISELANIKNRDISIDGKTAYLSIVGKGGKQRRVLIETKLLERIQNTFGRGDYLFTSRKNSKYSRNNLSTEIGRMGACILGKRISCHTFRHTFATHSIKKQGSVKAISQYLGHANTSTTESMYLHVELSKADVLNLYKKTA